MIAKGTARPCLEAIGARNRAASATATRCGPLLAVHAVIYQLRRKVGCKRGEVELHPTVVALEPLAMLSAERQHARVEELRIEWALDYPDAVVEVVS